MKFRLNIEAMTTSRVGYVTWLGAVVLFNVFACSAFAATGHYSDKAVVFQTSVPQGFFANEFQLENKAIDGKPKAILIVTQLWSVAGGSIYNPHPVGVYYSESSKKWLIASEDGSLIPAGAQFNVRAMPGKTATTFQLDTTVENTTEDYTIINDKSLNTNSQARLFVTHLIDPNPAIFGSEVGYLGVWFMGTNWAVYDDDTTQSKVARYNLVDATFAPGSSTQSGTNSTIVGDHFPISDPSADNNPNAVVFVTHNGTGMNNQVSYVNHPIGVFYSGGKWNIFDEDQTAIGAGVTFNVLVYPAVTP